MKIPNVATALDFSDRVVLITGGSRGIGAGIARRFGETGASVVIGYSQTEQHAQEVADQVRANGGDALAVQADLRLAGDVDRLIRRAVAQRGQLDVLINNAGIYPISPL